MPIREAYAGTALPGDVYTAANHAKMPGGWIAYDTISAGTKTTSGTTELTLVTMSVTVGATRRLKATFHCRALSQSAANEEFIFRLSFNGSYFGRSNVERSTTTDAAGLDFSGIVDTTTAGSYTMFVSVQRSTGTGTLSIPSDASNEGWLLVEDIGPA